MEPAVMVAIAAASGLIALLLGPRLFPAGMFSGGAARIPKRFNVAEIPEESVSREASSLLKVLSRKLRSLGFKRAGSPVRVPALQRFGHQLVLAPFVHEGEASVFVMAIETHWPPRAELMLHIITPLTDGRRVETSTLDPLLLIRPPETVDLGVVEDPNSVDEIWSRHRRALSRYERAERQDVTRADWKPVVSAAYSDWVTTALRAQRLALCKDGLTYRLRLPS